MNYDGFSPSEADFGSAERAKVDAYGKPSFPNWDTMNDDQKRARLNTGGMNPTTQFTPGPGRIAQVKATGEKGEIMRAGHQIHLKMPSGEVKQFAPDELTPLEKPMMPTAKKPFNAFDGTH